MSNNVQIKEVGSRSDIRLINIRGLLDTVIAYRLQEKMDILIEDGIFKYIIDLEELEHISSAGIGLFSAMALELQKLHLLLLRNSSILLFCRIFPAVEDRNLFSSFILFVFSIYISDRMYRIYL